MLLCARQEISCNILLVPTKSRSIFDVPQAHRVAVLIRLSRGENSWHSGAGVFHHRGKLRRSPSQV